MPRNCLSCQKPLKGDLYGPLLCGACARSEAQSWMLDNGYRTEDECLELYRRVLLGDDNAPAICAQGCEVEPDGTCPHGYPAVTRAMGMI